MQQCSQKPTLGRLPSALDINLESLNMSCNYP